MANEFSTLEIQLIRSSFTTKSDEDIAELLERSVEEITEKINELTSGGAADRSRAVAMEKIKMEEERLATKKKKVSPAQERKAVEAAYEKKETKKNNSIGFQQAQRRKVVEGMASNRKYATREIDYSKMKSVRVNRSTHVWVPKEMPDDEAVQKFIDNKDHYNRKFIPTN